MGYASVLETVAVFHKPDNLQDAIDELMRSGFDRADLSFAASEKSIEEKLGHRYRKIAELEDNIAVPRSSYVALESVHEAEAALVGIPFYIGAVAAAGLVLGYGGSLVAEIKGAVVAGTAGGLLGFFFARHIGSLHRSRQREQLGHGGLLLWVRTPDVPRIKRAVEILVNHAGRDVHVHPA